MERVLCDFNAYSNVILVDFTNIESALESHMERIPFNKVALNIPTICSSVGIETAMRTWISSLEH